MNNTTSGGDSSTTATPITILVTTIVTAATTIFDKTDNGTSSNTTGQPSPRMSCPNSRDTDTEIAIKMACYIILLVVSLIGNILISAVILSNKKMRKPTNYFILNMALSDLVMPTMIHSRYLWLLNTRADNEQEWMFVGDFGEVSCKLVFFFQDVTTAVSIFSMILITIDRFIAVVYPMRHYVMSSTVCKISIVGTWFVATSLHAIYLYTYQLVSVHGKNICSSGWFIKFDQEYAEKFVRQYFLSLFFLLAIVPVIVMAFAYTVIIVTLKRQSAPLGDSFSDQQKRKRAEKERKILRMAIAIIVSFVLLWCLYNVYVLLMLFIYDDPKIRKPPCWLKNFRFVGFFLAYSNAAVNPMIVFIFSQNFRQGFMSMLGRMGIVSKRNIQQQNTTQVSMTMQNKAYED